MEARVIEVHRTNFTVKTAERTLTATVRGSFHVEGDFPKVGDYVRLVDVTQETAVIEEVLPRHSVIKRKAASRDEEQIIAANVDVMFVVMGLDGDFNISRLERYLVLAQQSAIPAVVILNKADMHPDPADALRAVQRVSGDAPVHLVSALTGEGMEYLLEHFEPETTAVLLGSSGAGKSTITNWLLGEDRQATKATREDDNRGRHTTTSRHLFALPGGGFLIDTPGMRELGILEGESSDEQAVFERISALAEDCRFRNCDHEKSAGCAVLAAVETGELSQREYQNYQKLLKEKEFLASKESDSADRHYEHAQKRQNQKNEAIRRQKLSRRLS
jgi:ribosome biogenesis GTPase